MTYKPDVVYIKVVSKEEKRRKRKRVQVDNQGGGSSTRGYLVEYGY